jgi:predicted N-acetyltransferase YhbS
MQISLATSADFPGIVQLVNAAYRGEASKQGWTTEAWFISGDKRTDEQQLEQSLNEPNAVILQLKTDEAQLLGCVFLRHSEAGLYLGMLSVWPHLQGGGIGKSLMWAAEDHARKVGAHRIFMNVISARTELVEWYERRGYLKTAQFLEFPNTPDYGVPMIPLEFVVMEKFI